MLAVKLPLLASHPELIFGGESRTAYQVDPALAAQLIGKPPGLRSILPMMPGSRWRCLRRYAASAILFQKAHVVVSVAPFLFNEGVRSAAVYPQDVLPRIGVFEQMVSFLPLRVGTLIRFIREAFAARLAAGQHMADLAPPAGRARACRSSTLPAGQPLAGRHRLARALCRVEYCRPQGAFRDRRAVRDGEAGRKVTVVIPPWAPRYDRARDPEWLKKDDQYAALVTRCRPRLRLRRIEYHVGPRAGTGQLRRRDARQRLGRTDLHTLSRIAVEALADSDAVLLLYIPVSISARRGAGLRGGAAAFPARRHPRARRRVAVFLRRVAADLSAVADGFDRARIFRLAC